MAYLSCSVGRTYFAWTNITKLSPASVPFPTSGHIMECFHFYTLDLDLVSHLFFLMEEPLLVFVDGMDHGEIHVPLHA